MIRFIAWTKSHLKLDTHVAMGVWMEGSYPFSYDHIVTAVEVIENGLRFNEHYSIATKTITTQSLPKYDSRCSKEYCFDNYMNGGALQKPLSVSKERLVRPNVSSDPFSEPNWTCDSIAAKKMTLEATVAYPDLLDDSQDWYIAVTFRGTNASGIRSVVYFSRGLHVSVTPYPSFLRQYLLRSQVMKLFILELSLMGKDVPRRTITLIFRHTFLYLFIGFTVLV